MNKSIPGYRYLYQTGELRKRVTAFREILSNCTLCPRKCGVNRTQGEKGSCRAPGQLKVAKALPHFGEEPAITGQHGSGAIFFSYCNLRCCFCQNYQISQRGLGEIIAGEELAKKMLALQKTGSHNINLVSATHFLPQIIQALCLAAEQGLSIPLVYNTNGYESLEILHLLNGIVDIYLPDAKYGGNECAAKYSQAGDYPTVNQAALQEMFRQVGQLVMNKQGLAVKGLIIRHLVLPGNVSDTKAVLSMIKTLLGSEVTISLMGQYLPAFKASGHEELSKRLSKKEYGEVITALEELEFENGWIQEWEEIDGTFLPDFQKSESWN